MQSGIASINAVECAIAVQFHPSISNRGYAGKENDLERELARWLSSTHEPDAAAGFRAGWRRLGQLAAPRIREWERLWWKTKREGDSLRSRLGVLLRELSRLTDDA